MWFYIFLAIVLYIILIVCYHKIKDNPGKHESGMLFFLPGLVAILILATKTVTNHPEDIKLVNLVAEKIRCYNPQGEDENESPRYSLVFGNGDEMYIPRNTYQYFHSLWLDCGENDSCTEEKSGISVVDTEWNRDPGTSLIVSKPVEYRNYLMNVHRIYDIQDRFNITRAVENGLIIRQGVGTVTGKDVIEPRQNLILGIHVSDSIQRKVNYIASLDSMFRPVLLVWGNEFENKTSQQRNLWKSGKENEVVFCIGLGEDNEILWSGSFSWDKTGEFESFILREVLKPGMTLDLDEYVHYLEEGYKKDYWNPINLSRYDFLKLPLNQIIVIGLMSFIILSNLILSLKLLLRKRKST